MTDTSDGVRSDPQSGRGGLHRKVVDILAMQIIKGDYEAGSPLPVEAEICRALGVGRSSVREAMRVLADKGMIEVRPRTGTKVLDRASWRRLDPDLVRWMLAAGSDQELFADLVEARRIFEPAAAMLAAKRATGADLAHIEVALTEMIQALPGDGNDGDLEACVEADIAFHKAILSASGNTVLEEFEVVIDGALRAAIMKSTELAQSYAKAIAAHGEVYEAIRMRDERRAGAAMSSLLDVAVADLRLDSRSGTTAR